MSFSDFFIDILDISGERFVFRVKVAVVREHISDDIFDAGEDTGVIDRADEEEFNIVFGFIEGVGEFFGIEVKGVDIAGHSRRRGFSGDTDGGEVSKEFSTVLSSGGKDGSNLVFEA